MIVIRGATNLRPHHCGTAITLGNFDGLHRGHQALIARMAARASETGGKPTVVTFEPLPMEYLCPDKAPLRLWSLRDKLEGLRELGVAQVLVLRFDRRLAATEAREFVERYLIGGLGARAIVIGDDYRFGRDAAGDFGLLQSCGEAAGVTVERLETVRNEAERISSTAVRAALAEGEVARATTLLGRPYRVSGRVISGRKLGRTLGTPTANLRLRHRGALRHGVYCVSVGGMPGVANFGLRPTVDETRVELLEVHLLDTQMDLYGQRIRVDFEHFLRPEARFDGVEALRDAIAADVKAARNWFQMRKVADGAEVS